MTGIFFFKTNYLNFKKGEKTILLFFAPFVFFPDLFLFAGGEVVLDVEGLANVFRGLALDHVRHGLASDVKQPLEKDLMLDYLYQSSEYRTSPVLYCSNLSVWLSYVCSSTREGVIIEWPLK